MSWMQQSKSLTKNSLILQHSNKFWYIWLKKLECNNNFRTAFRDDIAGMLQSSLNLSKTGLWKRVGTVTNLKDFYCNHWEAANGVCGSRDGAKRTTKFPCARVGGYRPRPYKKALRWHWHHHKKYPWKEGERKEAWIKDAVWHGRGRAPRCLPRLINNTRKKIWVRHFCKFHSHVKLVSMFLGLY